MKRILAFACLAFVLASTGFAQTISKEERAKRSTEILAKFRKIDLLNQILPVLMTKSQLSAVMGAIEKVQPNVEKSLKFEYEQMAKLEKELDTTIAAGIEKGELPRHDFVMKIAKTYSALSMLRQAAIGENIDIVRPILTKALNSGQLKAAENCIDATFFDPSLKKEDLTDAKKLDMYIKVVLLDPLAYGVLSDMFKAAK